MMKTTKRPDVVPRPRRATSPKTCAPPSRIRHPAFTPIADAKLAGLIRVFESDANIMPQHFVDAALALRELQARRREAPRGAT